MLSYFSKLINIKGWKIYFIERNLLISSAFVYENKKVVIYIIQQKIANLTYKSWNSLIDLIIQKMIKEKKIFDFLKGNDRYKLDLGGSAISFMIRF